MERTGGKPTKLDDSSLVELALQRDQGAFALLLEKYRSSLMAHVLKYVSVVEDAEDICQRSFEKAFIEAYFQSYPGVKAYMDAVVAQAREKGYVETLFGRKRFLPDIGSKNAVARGLAERNAINAPIQGSAADIIKLSMIAVSRRFAAEGLKSKMVLQVHDELVFDVTADERDRVMEIVKQEMESVCTLSVPLITECNYGKNWREAH